MIHRAATNPGDMTHLEATLLYDYGGGGQMDFTERTVRSMVDIQAKRAVGAVRMFDEFLGTQ